MVTDMFEKCNSSVNLKSSNSSILETSKKIVFLGFHWQSPPPGSETLRRGSLHFCLVGTVSTGHSRCVNNPFGLNDFFMIRTCDEVDGRLPGNAAFLSH
jgi:hypothetical protein